MCVQSRQFDLAAALARTRLVDEFRATSAPLCQRRDITGWVNSLGRKFTMVGRFLLDLPTKWEWLNELFENVDNYQACVCSYYVLSVNPH
jgi:hypothetical protein